jgi:hypothetical protein
MFSECALSGLQHGVDLFFVFEGAFNVSTSNVAF